MNQQFDFLARSVDFFRSLGDVMLANSEEAVSYQLDSTKQFFAQGTEKIRASMTAACDLPRVADGNELIQLGLRDATQMTRDCVVASSGYQNETQQLLQRQMTDVQKVFANSLDEQLADMDWKLSRNKRYEDSQLAA